jgi:hypothetical protein
LSTSAHPCSPNLANVRLDVLSRRRIAVHEILQPMQIAIETTRIIQCKGRIENVRPFGEVFAPPRAESQTSNGVERCRTASGSAFGSTAEGPASCQAPSQTCHEYSACSRPGCSLTCSVFGLSWIQLNGEEAKPSNTADFRSGAVSSTKSVCRKSQPARGCTLWYNFQLEI